MYIRRYENGDIKYYLCNAPEDTPAETLDWLSTMRWSIEQCFQECKSYLGMSHYETRTYAAWHMHMLLVMIAHLFTLRLRLADKKFYFTMPMVKYLTAAAIAPPLTGAQESTLFFLQTAKNAASFRSFCRRC